MHIGVLSATTQEIEPVLQYLLNNWNSISLMNFQKSEKLVFPLVTGIGSTSIAFALARFQSIQKMDFVLHLGVSGSFDAQIKNGELLEVVSEQWGDLGAEEADGNFLDAFELNLMEPNRIPFARGIIHNLQSRYSSQLKPCKGLTVNSVTGTQKNADLRKLKFGASLESMEGMGLFYACRMLDLPFMSIRAVSNPIGPRNKELWDLPLAIKNLNDYAIEFLENRI